MNENDKSAEKSQISDSNVPDFTKIGMDIDKDIQEFAASYPSFITDVVTLQLARDVQLLVKGMAIRLKIEKNEEI